MSLKLIENESDQDLSPAKFLMLPSMMKNPDGSLTIYVQNHAGS